MNIVFVSRCTGESIAKTRRTLDGFAVRKGDSTWNASMTQEALQTVFTELKQNASKTTAVAIFNAHNKDSLKLLYVVGKRSAFSESGIAPIRTSKPIKEASATAPFAMRAHLCAIATLAALTHDLGKASKGFQNKLRRSTSGERLASSIRHELASAIVASSMLKGGLSWEQAWQNLHASRLRLKTPFTRMDNPIDLAMAMVLTHHRLMGGDDSEKDNESLLAPYLSASTPELRGEDAELFDTSWQPYENDFARDAISRISRILSGDTTPSDLKALGAVIESAPVSSLAAEATPAMFHLGRTALQLADHHYSATGIPGDTLKSKSTDNHIAANTIKSDDGYQLHQPLEEHLAGVTSHIEPAIQAIEKARFGLGGIRADEINLPGELPERFAWQQAAVDLTATVRRNHPQSGVFGVLNASTGRGKTIASLRVAASACASENVRLTIASPMRLLTRQAHAEYSTRTMINPADLALAVGGIFINDAQSPTQSRASNVHGSDASLEDDLEIFSTKTHDVPKSIRRYIGASSKAKEFIGTPILCCTVDYINRAAEPHRGSHLIAYLRLVSSDVIIDEADDFELGSLLRIAYIVGLAGRNLFISTATMHATAVSKIYQAYRQGYLSYAAMRGTSQSVQALLLSESNQTHIENCNDIQTQTKDIWAKRVSFAKDAPALRMGEIIDPQDRSRQAAFKAITQAINVMHKRHHVKVRDKTISAGFVRLDRVKDCAAYVEFLNNNLSILNVNAKVILYHGAFTNAERAYKNHKLSKMLKRSGGVDGLLEDKDARDMLTKFQHSTIIIVTTSTGERGNDWDLDWGIMEPTSISSIIQAVGRLLRHRRKMISEPNLAILRYAVNPGKGFKQDIHYIAKEDLSVAICDEFLEKIDSRALLGDEALENMDLLKVGLEHKLLNDKEFFKKLGKSESAGHIGVAMSNLYKPPLREKTQQQTIEIDESGNFLDANTGHEIPIGYKHFDDSHLEHIMFGLWRRSDVYNFVFEHGNMSSWQRKIGMQLTHDSYDNQANPKELICSDALGLFTQ